MAEAAGSQPKSAPRGLQGIKVIEAAAVLAGPMAGRLLADWGADVVHIEHPVRGDITRAQAAGRLGGRIIPSDINYISENYNRNKRGMTLDLSHQSGREVMSRLLDDADIFLSNLRGRELKKFNLEYETLSHMYPRLVYANVTGYGKQGLDNDLPGYEHTGYFARSGMFHVLQVPGTHPLQVPLGLGDNVTGLALAYGIMAALFMRERTGKGQAVDVSLFRTGVFAISLDIAGALVTGQDRKQLDRQDVANATLNSYQTKDGRWLRLGLAQPDLYWAKLCRAVGREDLEHDPRFASFEPRVANHVDLFHILEEVFLSRTLKEWATPLTEAGIPWAPVQTLPEVTADPQARANDFFIGYDHPTHGRIEGVANPVTLSDTPEVVSMSSPEFGQHTEEILLEIGYSWEDIERFKEQGVIA